MRMRSRDAAKSNYGSQSTLRQPGLKNPSQNLLKSSQSTTTSQLRADIQQLKDQHLAINLTKQMTEMSSRINLE
jgi:hypothetical protein